MKRVIFTLITILFATGVFAQVKRDTIVTKTTTIISSTTDTTTASTTTTTTTYTDTIRPKKKFKFSFGSKRDTIMETPKKEPGFSFDVTVSRIDIGFATLVDNGSFTLSPTNNFLRYRSWKSSNFGLDLLQMGYRFNSSFKIYLSGGFDWTSYRLREDVSIVKGQPVLTHTDDAIDYSKNTFSSVYLRVPLTFYWRSKDDNDGHRFHLAGGPITGLLINGHTRHKSKEEGFVKQSGGFNLTKFQYGAFIRAGYGGIGFYAKYYFNDMFEDSPAQKGLRQMSLGATIGF
jgi:hypothetical protein